MPVTSQAFKAWLKASTNIKLSSDAAVLRVTHEGITNFASLSDFDKKSIENLPGVCKNSIPAIEADPTNSIASETSVAGANVSLISVRRLITAVNATKYYGSIARVMNPQNMAYSSVLAEFKIEYEAYLSIKDDDDAKVPKINDKDADRKIIRWAPIFKDCLSSSFGPRGPLIYVLREDPEVPDEVTDPLLPGFYYGESGSLISELEARLSHSGSIFKNDNATVCTKIEEAARGTSVESTIKSFSRSKNGRGVFQALTSNHAGEVKHRSISKKRLNLLQKIKWNGRSHALESHVSNHRQGHDDLLEYFAHIQCAVPSPEQKVEHLIDRIACTDSTLQAAIGLIRANTNNMREDFEAAASSLIEVDPYRRTSRGSSRNAAVSSIDFKAGRGSSGVDLRWHPKDEYFKLSREQKNELASWLNSPEGIKEKRKNFRTDNRKRDQPQKRKANSGGKDQKSKFLKAIKTDSGLKSIMSIMATEEQTNQALVSALVASNSQPSVPVNQVLVSALTASGPQPSLTVLVVRPSAPHAATTVGVPINPPAQANVSTVAQRFPATNVKLQSILKK